VAGFKHPCLKPLGVHLKARVIALQNFCKISNFLQNLVLIPQHSPFPTVPLSLKNPQHYQRSEFAAAHSRKVDFATAHSRLTICIAPSLNPDRSAIPQKSATLAKVGICCGSQPQGRFCYGLQPPDNLHSTIAKPRPFCYPSKIRNIIKGRNCQRRLAA